MLLIKNAEIFTGAGRTYPSGDILVDHGVIQQLGPDLDVPDAEILDAKGLLAVPGLVDAHSHVGGFGQEIRDQDLNEMTNCATPEMEALFGIDSQSPMFQRILQSGITTSAVAPGSGNVIGGVVCVVKSHGKNLQEMCIKNPVALKMALGGNPKGVYGKRNQRPMTRMAIAQIIRETMIKGQEYAKKKATGESDPEKMPPYDQGMEFVGMALRREIPVKIHCTQYDMLTAIGLAEEFGLEFTLDHAWGASDYYDEITAAQCRGIIYGPIGVPVLPGELRKTDIGSLIELDRRGVLCAIMTDGPIFAPEMLLIQAGEVIRCGGDWERVMNMVTINAAEILGVADRVGSLEPGKDADVVLFQGRPAYETDAQPMYTIVNGDLVWSRP